MLLSFLFDIPIFLPVLGVLLFWLASQGEKGFRIGWGLVYFVTLLTASFCLYFKQYYLLALLLFFFFLAKIIDRKRHHFLWTFGLFTLAIFWLVSGGLYFDLWGPGGNHFMWYSWLDKMGVIEARPVPTPTYLQPFGFWNLFGFFLFFTYPLILIGVGRPLYRFFRWLKGIFFGHIKGQTGLWGLLTNR